MERYYFFRSVDENGARRVRPLPNQQDESSNPILEELNVQCSRTVRMAYPEGTVFASTMCETRASNGAPFYAAGDIYPVSIPDSEITDFTHIPPAEMRSAFTDYRMRNPEEAASSAPAINSDGSQQTALDALKANPAYAMPTIDRDGFFVTEKNWWLIMLNIAEKTNTMLIGPSGTGKTELVALAAKKLGLPFHWYDMGVTIDPITTLLGTHRIDGDHKSVFEFADFVEQVQKPGVILLDELSRAQPLSLNILFPCLDGRRTLRVDMAGCKETREVKVHPDCVFFATANVGAEYTGTMSMDRALTGRFFPIELDYMSEDNEALLLRKRFGGLAASAAKVISSVAREIRELHSRDDLSNTVSTRETLAAAKLAAAGWSPLEALEMAFLPLFEGTVMDGERSIVHKIFMSK